jgi:choline dehydrogenase-like flavoprotein
MGEPYDVIIVGIGAAGGTLEHPSAAPGERILRLERGEDDPRPPGYEADIVVLSAP